MHCACLLFLPDGDLVSGGLKGIANREALNQQGGSSRRDSRPEVEPHEIESDGGQHASMGNRFFDSGAASGADGFHGNLRGYGGDREDFVFLLPGSVRNQLDRARGSTSLTRARGGALNCRAPRADCEAT
jgi:hypothetical protein